MDESFAQEWGRCPNPGQRAGTANATFAAGKYETVVLRIGVFNSIYHQPPPQTRGVVVGETGAGETLGTIRCIRYNGAQPRSLLAALRLA